ncbi:MAG: cold shock domain-containing protein, partial [Bacteroidota bacterium]
MADSFNKKEREKKKRKRKKEKAEKKLRQKLEGKKSEEFMYVDADGNLTSVKPDPAKKQEFEYPQYQTP